MSPQEEEAVEGNTPEVEAELLEEEVLPTSCFVLLNEQNVIIQTQPNAQEGFLEAPLEAVCGMVFENGELSLQPVPDPDQAEEIKAQIFALEASQTLRRIREAALGKPGAVEWLENLNNQITALRAQL